MSAVPLRVARPRAPRTPTAVLPARKGCHAASPIACLTSVPGSRGRAPRSAPGPALPRKRSSATPANGASRSAPRNSRALSTGCVATRAGLETRRLPRPGLECPNRTTLRSFRVPSAGSSTLPCCARATWLHLLVVQRHISAKERTTELAEMGYGRLMKRRWTPAASARIPTPGSQRRSSGGGNSHSEPRTERPRRWRLSWTSDEEAAA